MKKRLLSMLLICSLVLTLLPVPAFAETGRTPSDISEMNALEAIGIDTSVAPEGYDENDTSNPYGRDSVTVNPVSELLLLQGTYNPDLSSESELLRTDQVLGQLWGHDKDFNAEYDTKVTPVTGNISAKYSSYIGNDGSMQYPYGAYTATSAFAGISAAAGNFVGNDNGQEKQYAMLALERGDDGAPSKLKLYVLDAVDASSADDAVPKTLISDFSSFGNARDKGRISQDESITTLSMMQYQIQNYLKIAAGDFDGNGVDELAVYIPDNKNPRIEVYQYKPVTGASATAYQNASANWACVWTYSIPIMGSQNYVPNMVSLLSADIHEDGVDDLALTYSYFYDVADYGEGRAAVLYGSRSGSMLTSYHDFPLISTENDAIVRAAFTYGPLSGAGQNSLVLGGQSLRDLKAGLLYSRYAAI